MTTSRKLWIFLVVGGESFAVQVQGNPVMRHEGGRSLLRCLCSDAQADDLERTMREHGADVTRNCPSETAGQRREREHVLAVLGEGRPFPTPRCPSCAWLDVQLASLCGAGLARGEGWEEPVVKEAFLRDKFGADYHACPLLPAA